ncbi:hypothetical protein AU097_gp126 [Klebsiella phage JD18]|jgi:hypothetical protein|uniref:Uncharacterized protein n=2 Tax=Caudoviricetes TaxID=2731619 RepID=A0A0K1Y4S9_9CAUD|nr:hypothetical protein AU097_gp126 [Klebsiella phage JD18]AKY01997.1 hypothetical protein JD18_126 [Klebsiella phage JD18]UGO48482.1 hypothetical protein BOBOTO_127 [Klebsiella phage vB_KaeM_Boboto]UWG89163.1 MAG: hypothetical protein [Bacteriophage sp.]WAB00455.1 hypothetical protein [Klebsiella phage JY1]
MKVKFGQVIPKGLAMAITTWENDADRYSTQMVYGLEKEEINQVIHVLEWFSSNGRRGEYLGNNDYNHEAILEKLHTEQKYVTPEFSKKFFGVDVPAYDCSDEEFDAYLDNHYSCSNEVMYAIQAWLGNPIEYDYDFMRVFEKVEIFDIKEEIRIPDAPVAFHVGITYKQKESPLKVDWLKYVKEK